MAPQVVVCVAGAGQIAHGQMTYAVTTGDVVLLPAMLGACEFQPHGAVYVLVAVCKGKIRKNLADVVTKTGVPTSKMVLDSLANDVIFLVLPLCIQPLRDCAPRRTPDDYTICGMNRPGRSNAIPTRIERTRR